MHGETFWQKRQYLAPLVLFLLAFLTRLAAVGRYITPDELIWVYRSVQFSEAVQNGAWSETLTTGHPGVTITWLGALAITLQRLIDPTAAETYRWISHLAWLRPENMAAMRQLATFLTAGRLLVIGLHGLGIVAIFLLVRRLFSYRFAVTTAVLLIFDPFLAGLSGLLHVDAAQTMFATVSLLALALALREGERFPDRWTAVSAAAAALSLLTKSPAILLLPICLFFLTVSPLLAERPWSVRLRASVQRNCIWLGVYLLTLFALLPALWVSPNAVFSTVFTSSRRFVEDALRPTFFMGESAIAHPATFYPIAVAFRLTPLVFLGLLFAAGLALLYARRLASLQQTAVMRQTVRAMLIHPATIFLLWSAGYVIGITLAEKKFDRYALPIFPALTLLALLGWFGVWERWQTARRAPLVPLLAALALVNYLPVAPYPLMGYNVLLGGPWTAQHVLPLGWGDSVSAGTRWLEQNAETRNSSGIGGISQAFVPFFSGQPLLASDAYYPQADYVVWSKLEEQMRLAQGAERPFSDATLLHTVRFGGLEQAWIYRRAQPSAPIVTASPLPEPIRFDHRIALTGSGVAHIGDSFHALLRWRLLDESVNGRYTLRLTLLDSLKVTWYQTELPLLNDTDFYPAHWPEYDTEVRYVIPAVHGMPPGDYSLTVSLIEAQTGALMPIFDQKGTFTGTTAVVSQTELPSTAINTKPFPTLPVAVDLPRGQSEVTLLGYDALPEAVASGAPLNLTLYWRADEVPMQDYWVRFWIDDAFFDQPLSRFPTSAWRAGTHLLEHYALEVPPDLEKSESAVSVELLDENAEPLTDSWVSLGRVRITPVDRLFARPPIELPLDYMFGDQMRLLGMDVFETAVSPGETVTVTLYWQVIDPPPQLIAAFIHVVRPDGSNLMQSDQWPGGLPSALYATGQIIVDQHTLVVPGDAAPGRYPLRVGLYQVEDGTRYAAVDASGVQPSDNRTLLPLQIEVAE